MSGYNSSYRSSYGCYRDLNHGNITINGVDASKLNSNGIEAMKIKVATGEGVQIKETDRGQPCTECTKCISYEPHSWRKNCKNCKCLRDGHEIVAEHGARSRLGLTISHDGLDSRSLGYTFVPAGLTTARQVDQYYSSLPTHEVPKLGSKGEIARLQRIVKQLPKQDLALSACKFVEDSVKTSYQDFITARNEIALDIGIAKPAPPNSMCDGCNRSIPNQQVSVVAPRMGKLIWHPACFRCTTCDDLLVDLSYCVYEEKIYCERHYAELLKPRCEGCDEGSCLNSVPPIITEHSSRRCAGPPAHSH